MKRTVGRLLVAMSLTAGISAFGSASAPEPVAPHQNQVWNFDLRVHSPSEAQRLLERHGAPLQRIASELSALKSGIASRQARAPHLEVTVSPLVGAAELVRSRRGALTEPALLVSGQHIALAFLETQAELYGLTTEQLEQLRFVGESFSAKSGLRMVRLEQTVDGLPVFQGEIRVILDPQGRVIRTVGRLVPGLSSAAIFDAGRISAPEALQAALRAVHIELDSTSMTTSRRSDSDAAGRVEIWVASDQITGPVTAWPVLFPLGPGLAVPAWAQVIWTRGAADYYTVVAALDGTLLWRKNLRHHVSRQEARFSVYVQADGMTPAESPAPGNPNRLRPGGGQQFPAIERTVVHMSSAQDPVASPDGWIRDGGDTTSGNNADVYLDTDADNAPDGGVLDRAGRPVGNPDAAGRNRDFLGSSPRDFDYSPPPVAGNPGVGESAEEAAVRRGALTQAFYTANWYHDRLYRLGFDEAAGNYQRNNFGRGGRGGDPILIENQDGAYSDDGNFSAAPDGTSARIQLFTFRQPDPDRDPGLDAHMVIHELTHGLTLRVVGNGAGLNFQPGESLGEGWSDFYVQALLHSSNAYDPDGQYAGGGYVSYRRGGLTDNYLYGFRRFPYTTDNTINPLTWGDTDDTTIDTSGGIRPSTMNGAAGANQIHNAGELWCLSLWEVRSRIIAAHRGNVAEGNEITLQLVTDALKLTPADPTFIQARDALLDADCATNRCAHEQQIWAGFADRGLGYGADTSSVVAAHYGVRESFAVPYLDVARIIVDDSAGNGNSSIDPGETVAITVELMNPWRAEAKAVTSVAATLTSSTPGIEVLDGHATFGAIGPSEMTSAADSFLVRIDSAVSCGQSLDFSIRATSSRLGTTTASFSLRVGEPTGPGEQRVFGRRIPGGLPIPDYRGSGALDSQRIGQDLEIADLDLRIDELRHSFVGDLTVMLKGPSGYGLDVIYRPAGADCGGEPDIGCNGGNDFINTVIDDSSRNDLLMAGSGAAPFTGRWLPVANSPSLGEERDPSGQLGNFTGSSTRGEWTVFVADYKSGDVGTLKGWSLLVRPQTYSCQSTPDEYLYSPEFPDFRFRVTIAGGETATVGRKESECIDETLCVSGALPGRSELFARVIGPRPNGFLHVNLVRFTAAQVEVEIEQLSTGRKRIYVLPAIPRHSDALTGLVDRTAFEPSLNTDNPAASALLAPAGASPAQRDGGWLSSPEFPDFRFKTTIRNGEGEIAGAREVDCLPETVCVSGALPGRSELFLRIIGPRPNGHLWLNLVRFTTSEVEVEVEQLSTGERQIYMLEAIPRSSEELTGQVDREAFLP